MFATGCWVCWFALLRKQGIIIHLFTLILSKGDGDDDSSLEPYATFQLPRETLHSVSKHLRHACYFRNKILELWGFQYEEVRV